MTMIFNLLKNTSYRDKSDSVNTVS